MRDVDSAFLDLNLFKFGLGAGPSGFKELPEAFIDASGANKYFLSGEGQTTPYANVVDFEKTLKKVEDRANIRFDIENEEDMFWSFLFHQKLTRLHYFEKDSKFLEIL